MQLSFYSDFHMLMQVFIVFFLLWLNLLLMQVSDTLSTKFEFMEVNSSEFYGSYHINYTMK